MTPQKINNLCKNCPHCWHITERTLGVTLVERTHYLGKRRTRILTANNSMGNFAVCRLGFNEPERNIFNPEFSPPTNCPYTLEHVLD